MRASGLFLEATDPDGSTVAAGGPLQGATVLTITYTGTLGQLQQRLLRHSRRASDARTLGRALQGGSTALAAADASLPPFVRLNSDLETVLNQSRCAFGVVPPNELARANLISPELT